MSSSPSSSCNRSPFPYVIVKDKSQVSFSRLYKSYKGAPIENTMKYIQMKPSKAILRCAQCLDGKGCGGGRERHCPILPRDIQSGILVPYCWAFEDDSNALPTPSSCPFFFSFFISLPLPVSKLPWISVLTLWGWLGLDSITRRIPDGRTASHHISSLNQYFF